MTASTERRTIHNSYVDLDPTEYSYVTSFDAWPEAGAFIGGPSEYTFDGTTVTANNAVHAEYLYGSGLLRSSSTSKWGDSGQCDHCGARLRYTVVMHHEPTDSHMAIGETCLNERFEHSSKIAKDLDRLRKRAAAERALAKFRKESEAWLESDPQNLEAYEYAEANREEFSFFGDLLYKFKHYGPWSERQRDAVLKIKAEEPARLARKAEREAEVKVPVVEGRQVLTGTVIKVDWQDNEWGGRTVLTLKEDRGFLVWGTAPSAIAADVEKGDRIQFQATVTASDREGSENFGFFKRPSKAKRVGEVA